MSCALIGARNVALAITWRLIALPLALANYMSRVFDARVVRYLRSKLVVPYRCSCSVNWINEYLTTERQLATRENAAAAVVAVKHSPNRGQSDTNLLKRPLIMMVHNGYYDRWRWRPMKIPTKKWGWTLHAQTHKHTHTWPDDARVTHWVEGRCV